MAVTKYRTVPVVKFKYLRKRVRYYYRYVPISHRVSDPYSFFTDPDPDPEDPDGG